MKEELVVALKELLYDPLTGKFVFLAIATTVLLVLVKGLQKTAANYVSDTTLRYRVRKLIEFGGFILFVFLLSVIFNDRLGNLTIAFGVAGAGIAFALQEVIASIAGWFAITFNGFFRPGERVLLGGICGDVIDIGVLRTTLMECGAWVDGDLYNGRIVRVANSYIFKEPVYNYSTDFPFLWDEITIPIRYGSNLKMARSIMEEQANSILGQYTRAAEQTWTRFAKKFLLEHARIEPMVTIEADENWVTLTIRYITDYKLRRATKDRLYREILEEIEANNGEVSIAAVIIELMDTGKPIKLQQTKSNGTHFSQQAASS